MNLKTLFAIERIKLARPGNYILLGLMIVLNLAIAILYFYDFSSSENKANLFSDLGQEIIAAQTSLSSLLISIFLILNISKEYQDGTLRKNLIDGLNRNDFYIGKITILTTCCLTAFIIGIVSLLIGSLVFNHLNDFISILSTSFLINFFVKLFYAGIFAVFLIFITKKLSTSLVLYFLWSMIEGIIIGFQSVFVNFDEEGEAPSILWNEYLPKSSFNEVLKLSDLVEPKAVIISSIYILIFTFLPYFLFLKSDIKS